MVSYIKKQENIPHKGKLNGTHTQEHGNPHTNGNIAPTKGSIVPYNGV